MPKRYYFQKTTTTITNEKGWIEVDDEYTQVYKSFAQIAPMITSGTSWNLLFWLLAEQSGKEGGFRTDVDVYRKFSTSLREKTGKSKTITRSTFQNCINELYRAQAITKVSNGFYYFNPHMFWQDSTSKRTDFIESEIKDGYASFNPVNLLDN